MNLSVREIAEACGGKLVQGEMNCDICVSSVVIDSRRVEAGGVFIAVPGERVDGHRFVSSVFEAGACLAVVEKTPEQVQEETGTDCSRWGSYVLVEESLQALKDIAEYYRRKLNIRIVGITGSVGKTSTKEFIAGVLAVKLKVLKTEGNFNNEIGVPLTLLRIREEHEAAVVEMGISDFGEMHRLSKMVRPDICVITNIGQCHLENLKTRDGILKAKSEIFDFMAEDGEICLNGEDDKLSALREVKGRKPHFFGLGGNPLEEVAAGNIESHGLWGSDAVLQLHGTGSCGLDENGVVRKETTDRDAADRDAADRDAAVRETVGRETAARGAAGETVELPIHVPLPGNHMVLNAAAAACVAGLFGLGPEEIARGIGGIEPVSGRNHLIRLPGYTLIDDCYNANPASMRAAIDLLAMADTEKVAILGDMFELGEDSDALHAGVGEYAAAAGIDRIICVGENARYIFQAAERSRQAARLTYFPHREELLKALEERREEYIPEGSTVLIKASHGMEFAEVLKFLQERGA
ncbi:MAG: UDP-N-acetylmuramoyl-tripeptide--D-alanyl-D-alanine ligase [Butyrivibrio sp.]|nr:UDP-N-acetylmuramoyl-tripeptide--D-alanyl-D-alanine ligase [Acetatifactor muris]MCM1558180.1 UDP-N-acetylmuramoyl-tripeptide--D-alanyl-D-alanine ligase [Butyrivibrio sp.]